MEAAPSNSVHKTYQPVPTKSEQVLNEVNETVAIAESTYQKLFDRENRLNDLNEKAEGLAGEALQFKKAAKAVRRKMWWQNVKMQICLALTVIFVLAAIVLIVLWQTGSLNAVGHTSGSANPAPVQ